MKDETTCCFFRFINGFMMEYYKEMLLSKDSFEKKKKIRGLLEDTKLYLNRINKNMNFWVNFKYFL